MKKCSFVEKYRSNLIRDYTWLLLLLFCNICAPHLCYFLAAHESRDLSQAETQINFVQKMKNFQTIFMQN